MRNDSLPSVLPVNPVEQSLLINVTDEQMSSISQTYASQMPDWVVAKYFDPEEEKQRIAIHDYQQTEIQEMRGQHQACGQSKIALEIIQ